MKKIILHAVFLLFPIILTANDCNYIMDNNRMEVIINHINNKADDVKKLNIIQTYLQRLCINTNQMLEIIDVFESEHSKKEFFLYAKDYITDLENYNKINFK